MSDHQLDRAWKSYSHDFRTRVLPKLMDSRVFLSIGASENDFDVRQATELGAALLLDKPILLVCLKGRTLNAHLRRVADVIIEDFDVSDPASQQRIADAMRQVGML